MTSTPKRILPLIVAAQFSCTSLWFAGNAVVEDLIENYGLSNGALGHLTSSVQFGFIVGTLLFALLSIADRFSPSKVFVVCATSGAIVNLLALLPGQSLLSLLAVRFATGLLLAGIYPVGMKIAADHHEKGLGKALGFLVGALVLGTAFPHLVKGLLHDLPWQTVFALTSGISVIGGMVLYLGVPDGPFRRRSPKIDLTASFRVFKARSFRSAAFGYFGHMWELYAFWAFAPILLLTYNRLHTGAALNVSLYSFFIIAAGGAACVVGGYLAMRHGSAKVAVTALSVSGSCCLLSPFVFVLPAYLFIAFLVVWGLAVVADSPQFSTLVAQAAPKENTGTALTIVNCIGFAITIVSIETITYLHHSGYSQWMYLLLAPGPAFGIVAMLAKSRQQIHV